jgi:hypothetical protein
MANSINRAKQLKELQEKVKERFGIEDYDPLVELGKLAADPTNSVEMRADLSRFLLAYCYEAAAPTPTLTITFGNLVIEVS